MDNRGADQPKLDNFSARSLIRCDNGLPQATVRGVADAVVEVIRGVDNEGRNCSLRERRLRKDNNCYCEDEQDEPQVPPCFISSHGDASYKNFGVI